MQTLTSIRQRGWSGRIASLPLFFQRFKCHWTQENAVRAPLIIEVQRSHTSCLMKTLRGPQPPVGGPKLMYSSLTFGDLNDVPLNFGGKTLKKLIFLGRA